MAGSVAYQCDSGVGSIRLASPRPGNALDRELVGDLHRCLLEAESDQACRVLVLSAAGDTFCSGLSLEAAFGAEGSVDPTILQTYVDCLLLLCRSPKPTVARVEGDAAGGGVGLVAACDLVIASDTAGFALPEATIGLIPALITPFLLRRLTPARVRYLAISTRRIDAHEAFHWGLVDDLAGSEMDRVLHRQLQRLLRSSPEALAGYKAYLDRLIGDDLAVQAHTGLATTSAWMEQPDVVAAVQGLLAGNSVPWSQSYRRTDNADPG